MGSVLQCLVRICCDPDGDDNERNRRNRNRLTAGNRGDDDSSSSSVVVRALMARDNNNNNIINDDNHQQSFSSDPSSLQASSSSSPDGGHSDGSNFYQRAASFPGSLGNNNNNNEHVNLTGRSEGADGRHHHHHHHRHFRLRSNRNEEDEDDDDEICCQGRSHSHKSSKQEQHPEVRGIFDFFHQLQQRWHYDSLDTNTYNRARTDTAGTTSEELDRSMSFPVSSSPKHTRNKQQQSPRRSPHSPLRTALTFDTSRVGNIPTIRPEEVVLPGSLLQKQMAESMSLLQRKQENNAGRTLNCHQDECVICMEPFTADNPRMPTLCGCGENKAYFHLPCLYQWMEQSPDCPSCRQALRWQEFS